MFFHVLSASVLFLLKPHRGTPPFPPLNGFGGEISLELPRNFHKSLHVIADVRYSAPTPRCRHWSRRYSAPWLWTRGSRRTSCTPGCSLSPRPLARHVRCKSILRVDHRCNCRCSQNSAKVPCHLRLRAFVPIFEAQACHLGHHHSTDGS